MLKSKELSTRVITGAVYVAVMVVFFLPGLWVPLIPILLMMAVTFMSAFEKSQAVRLRMPGMAVLSVAILSVLLGLTALGGILKGTLLRGLTSAIDPSVNTVAAPRILGYYALLLFLVLPWAGLIRIWREGTDSLPQTVAEAAIILASSLPLASTIALLYGCRFGWRWLVLAILSAWVSDTCAYFAGRFLGRLRLAPAISPNKTWEGLVGGIVGTVILYLLYFPALIGGPSGYTKGVSFALAVVAAVVLSLSASFGDLKNSAIKRWCGIKDFGTLLPGHGGISDRFDSIFATLPAMLLIALLAGLIL